MTLDELRVRHLGVIDDLTVRLGPGMTALTGETGTGKTLVVEAIELLLGARAAATLVRPGADEARVEGRFLIEDAELILARAVAAGGRSRAYVDGGLASAATLGERGKDLVDLHGQHAHQALLSPGTQRAALDQAGGIDLGPVDEARRRLRQVEAALGELGGDERTRARELDLLRYQLAELDDAELDDVDEDDVLAAEERLLASAADDRTAAETARAALTGDGGALDAVGMATAPLSGRERFGAVAERLRGLGAELGDVAGDLRAVAETVAEDPARLDAIGHRRHLLHELRRKYGEDLAEVIGERERIRARVDELTTHDQRAAALDDERTAAAAALDAARAAVGQARRNAAPPFARAVQARLRTLAMPRARFDIGLGDDPAGDEVTWLLAANPGEPALPLAQVASGGELARTMLAARLELSLAGEKEQPRTLVFDEVDAGIGGEAALAVGAALAALARHHQVLVVTHLAQVAAFADQQIGVSKGVRRGRTVARAVPLEGEERIVELSRMLSGQPESATGRAHAEELLAGARGRGGRGANRPKRARGALP